MHFCICSLFQEFVKNVGDTNISTENGRSEDVFLMENARDPVFDKLIFVNKETVIQSWCYTYIVFHIGTNILFFMKNVRAVCHEYLLCVSALHHHWKKYWILDRISHCRLQNFLNRLDFGSSTG